MKNTYHAIQCRCGHRACKDWHVGPIADMQGVKFTEVQAHAVAALLNRIETDDGPPQRLNLNDLFK